MQFFPSELPYEQFAMLGIKKEDLRAMPTQTYHALLAGNRTSLMRFYFKDNLGEKVRLDGKLSLQRDAAGKPVLFYHPVRQELKNNFNLSDKDFEALKNDRTYFVEQTTSDKTGKKINLLVCVDKSTNELVAINQDALQPPVSVNGVQLTKEQQSDFLKGKTIHVNASTFKLNPNNEVGVDANKTKMIKIQNAKLDPDNLLFDVMLIATGLGGIVLLEHLLNFAHRHQIVEDKEKILKNEAVRNALAKAVEDFKRQQEMYAANGKDMNQLQGEYELAKSIRQQLLMLPDSIQQELKLLPEAQKFLEYPNPDENNSPTENNKNEEETFGQNKQHEQSEESPSNNFKFKR
ncbi:MAG: DUF3945 domain-containing protein [Tannerella sp.]|jgi:hypothetical protein|nr:DUF3945 domain-containing protein [Tannerella sp.]